MQDCLRTTWCPLLSIHDSEMDGRGQGTTISRGMKERSKKELAVSAFSIQNGWNRATGGTGIF